MRLLFFLSLLVIFGSSCKSDKKDTPKDILYGEVMFVHDEAMPLMSDINKQMRIIKSKRKKELAQDLDLAAISHLKLLESAEEAMMDWMADFDRSKMKSDDESAMKYLKDQKIKINQINIEMNDAVKNAKSFIEEISSIKK